MGTANDLRRLPAHARLIADDDVWMDSEGLEQLARVAASPGCVRAAGMPDLHAGPGHPIGAIFAFADRVRPELVGGDGGCGVRLAITTLRRVSADHLERRAEAAFADAPLAGCDPGALFEAVWERGPRALAELDGVPDALARLAEREPVDTLVASGDPGPYRRGFEAQLGSAGGGNHFAEVARVSAIHDEAEAEALGLEKNALVALAHSGSRGLGYALGQRWANRELRGDDIGPYLADLAGATRFARANRFVLAYRLLSALEAARPSKIAGGLDLVHNDVAREVVLGAPAWVHRKGAAPARGADPTVVLGSRGAPTWVMRGEDSEEGLRSVAHGAGRRMNRGEARDKLRHKYRRAALSRTPLGGRVIADDPDLLYEEHPDAYKPIEPVIRSVVEAGLASPIAELTPLLTIKK